MKHTQQLQNAAKCIREANENRASINCCFLGQCMLTSLMVRRITPLRIYIYRTVLYVCVECATFIWPIKYVSIYICEYCICVCGQRGLSVKRIRNSFKHFEQIYRLETA